MFKRATVAFALLCLGLCGLMTRLLTLSGEAKTAAAAGGAGASLTVATARGTIYDCRLRPLVNDTNETRFWIPPTPRALSALAKALPQDVFVRLAERLRGGRPILAVADDDWPQAGGALRFRVPQRYGQTVFAPHLIGYLGGDGHGVCGMEAAFDEWLTENAGTLAVRWEQNAAGEMLYGSPPKVTDTLANADAGVVLTIDRDIQIFAESTARRLVGKGAVLILDAHCAQVRAAVSLPAFQPGEVADLLKADDAPLLDRTLCNYNCGSVFKIVSAAAALESGISPDRRYTCTGSVTVDGVTFHCHNRLGHGELSMTEAFAQSCNCYFIRLIADAGPAALYHMAVNLGYDRALLPAAGYKTARATVPTLSELSVSPAALANLSFGQGGLLATAYHVAQTVGAVVDGGEVYRPCVAAGTLDAHGEFTPAAATPPQTAFSAATADRLRQMMIAAVADGATGEAARPLAGGAGGKTGTAETGWRTGDGQAVQSWFAGFYPAQDPQYVIVVIAEDAAATGKTAAAAFHALCDGLYSFMIDR